MSKLITPKKTVVSREELKTFTDFLKKFENFSRHSNAIETVKVEGGTLEIGIVIGRDTVLKCDTYSVYAKYDFGGKECEWFKLYQDDNGSVKHIIHVPNDINTIEGLENYIIYSEYINDFILNNIDLQKYLDHIPRLELIEKIKSWNCNYKEITCVLNNFELDSYDKHAIHKLLWKLKTEELNEVLSSKNGYNCYNGWRTKNDTLKMLGNSIDSLSDRLELVKQFNETYS